MFIYSGRYKTEEIFDKSLKFFSNTIYNKYREDRKEKNKKFIENVKRNPKKFGIDIVKKEIPKKATKPSLREEYRKRRRRV